MVSRCGASNAGRAHSCQMRKSWEKGDIDGGLDRKMEHLAFMIGGEPGNPALVKPSCSSEHNFLVDCSGDSAVPAEMLPSRGSVSYHQHHGDVTSLPFSVNPEPPGPSRTGQLIKSGAPVAISIIQRGICRNGGFAIKFWESARPSQCLGP